MNENLIMELHPKINNILEKYNAPIRLVKHLQLVTKVAFVLLKELKINFPSLEIIYDEVIFGAASHDIGKTIKLQEIYEKGKKHEQVGYKLLIQENVAHELARFTITHGQKDYTNLTLEDLIVILSDRIWKGKRVDLLEETIASNIQKQLNVDYWKVFSIVDQIISNIVIDAQTRISFQKSNEF